jgi:hypothetical protein
MQPTDSPVDTAIQLPLYELFLKVQKLDRLCGHSTVDTASYFLLFEILSKGYMLVDKESITLLCEKLWLKPYHEGSSILNRDILREEVELALKALAASAEKSDTPPVPPSPGTPTSPTGSKNRETVGINPNTPAGPTELAPEWTAGDLSVSVVEGDGRDRTAELNEARLASHLAGKRFLVKGVYLPVNPRNIEQSIRSYRHKLVGHGRQEIDLDATIRSISRLGYFNEWQLTETTYFNISWTVLIDNSPSMAAFSFYSEAIAKSITKGNTGRQARLFYFNNFPEGHLYNDPRMASSTSFGGFADGPRRNILIISDAGAARGNFNDQRIKFTLKFLRSLEKHRIAWINPMPRARWMDTSAELIAFHTDMFDIGEGSRDNLGNIVRLFKSKINTGKI